MIYAFFYHLSSRIIKTSCAHILFAEDVKCIRPVPHLDPYLDFITGSLRHVTLPVKHHLDYTYKLHSVFFIPLVWIDFFPGLP